MTSAATVTSTALAESVGRVVTRGRILTRNARLVKRKSIHSSRSSLRKAKTLQSIRTRSIRSTYVADARNLGTTVVQRMSTIEDEPFGNIVGSYLPQ